mgnify:CR=1 FL=1
MPVGLFGFVRKTTLVAGVIAASTSSSANSKSGRGARATGRPPATDALKAKISKAGCGTIASAWPAASDRRYTTEVAKMPSSSPFVSSAIRVGGTAKCAAQASTTALYGG